MRHTTGEKHSFFSQARSYRMISGLVLVAMIDCLLVEGKRKIAIYVRLQVGKRGAYEGGAGSF